MRKILWQEAAERVSNPAFAGLTATTKFHLAKLLLADSVIGDASLLAAIRVVSTRGVLTELERRDRVENHRRTDAA